MTLTGFDSWVPGPFDVDLFQESYRLDFDFIRLIMFIRWIESTVLDFGDEMQKVSLWVRSIGDLGLCLMWHITHSVISLWYFILGLADGIESFLISMGALTWYKACDISRVQNLAVVFDSKEALQTIKVLDLLRWLAANGVKNVCLYDREGVLKNFKEALLLLLKSEQKSKESTSKPFFEKKQMSLEVISFSDGKHAVTKAANFLLEKHYLSVSKEKRNLTESDMNGALGAMGYGGSEPDLMLIYGPARCHLGFPAWRIRYTEIVYMGPVKSMKFGSIIKAFHRFTMLHQNYGT
ncbi:uncharacterized protein [Primulina huaijiensis]|uniref:uncharacterized protein isoform X1 n=2 Tax=Primulina huaijiensis TaxID=1492673 RepID=UPI003CC7695A